MTQQLTEFELATGFMQQFAEAAARVAAAGETLSDVREYLAFCRRVGVRPTPERLELVRDLGAVLVEELVRLDLPAVQSAEAAGCCTVAAASLVDGLERHGWRVAFLAQVVEG